MDKELEKRDKDQGIKSGKRRSGDREREGDKENDKAWEKIDGEEGWRRMIEKRGQRVGREEGKIERERLGEIFSVRIMKEQKERGKKGKVDLLVCFYLVIFGIQ